MKSSWCGMGQPGEKLGSSVRAGFPLGDPGSPTQGKCLQSTEQVRRYLNSAVFILTASLHCLSLPTVHLPSKKSFEI